jgi:dipeptidyl aminopeptidase/acylaminoacyl peptidase
LAQRGYIVIHPDYRNHADSSDEPNPEERFRLGYVEDVINAVHAIRAADLPRVDASRVGMLGHSMGGGIAQTIAVTQPGLVDAIVLFAPVSTDARDNFEKWTTRRVETAQKIIAEHGAPEDNPEFWDSISPVNYLQNVTVPIMFHHGTVDESVPLAWSEKTAAELEALNKDVTLHVYPDEPHEFVNAWPQVMQRTTTFFDQHLKT